MTCSAVLTDWLDVTYSPEDHPIQDVTDVLQESYFVAIGEGKWRALDISGTGGGIVSLDERRSWARISASGAALAHLRALGTFMRYLSALSGAPHRVTRLDAALDTPEDGPDVIERLRALHGPSVRLTRKAVPTTCLLGYREDGRETGTWYAGHRAKAELTARVYDKQHERLQRAGEPGPARTRYELTFRKGIGPTLRDAAEPERIFWHYASPALLPRPEGVPAWESGWGGVWQYTPPPVNVAQLLANRVDTSEELGALVELADRLGPGGRPHLLTLLRRRLDYIPDDALA